MFKEVYPKLLLLGEYSILEGGNGLIIPLRIFSARLNFFNVASATYEAIKSNNELKEFTHYLEGNKFFNEVIDISKLKANINEGLFLKSTIPTGYGIGSSGAVCAAILKSYSKQIFHEETTPNELINLKSVFSLMESYFHGKSSGLDPLAIYCNKVLLINNESVKVADKVNIPAKNWFLIDSNISRNSRPFVTLFVDDYKGIEYKSLFDSEYLPYVDSLVDKIVNNNSPVDYDKINEEVFFNLWEKLSLYQLKIFHKMIPSEINKLWTTGLNSGLFYLKLTGAGGGGFFLGCTKDKYNTGNFFQNTGYKIIWLEL